MHSSEPTDSDRQMIEVSTTIKLHYGNVQLLADVLHVSGVTFLTSISTHVHCVNASAIDNMKAD